MLDNLGDNYEFQVRPLRRQHFKECLLLRSACMAYLLELREEGDDDHSALVP
jgi:hypothetical protein